MDRRVLARGRGGDVYSGLGILGINHMTMTQNERDIQSNMERGRREYERMKIDMDRMFGNGTHDRIMENWREPRSLDELLSKFPKKT